MAEQGRIDWHVSVRDVGRPIASITARRSHPGAFRKLRTARVSRPPAADGINQIIAGPTRVAIAGAGRWVQAEQPGAVKSAIENWLDNKNI